jgi:hypothetical protein
MEFGQVSIEESAERRADSRIVEHDVQAAKVLYGEVDRGPDVLGS